MSAPPAHPVARTRAPRVAWVLVAAAALVTGFLALSGWTGVCIDYAPSVPAESTCTMEPSLGWPGAIAVAVVCLAVVVLAAARIVRR